MQKCVALLQLASLGLRVFRAVGHFEFFHGAAPRGLAPNVFTHTPPHSWQSPAITHHLALAVRGPSQSPASLLSVGTHGRCCWAAGVVLSCVSAPPSPPEPLAYLYALLPSKPSTLWQGVVVFNMRVQTERTPPGFKSTFRESVCLRACLCIRPGLIAWR